MVPKGPPLVATKVVLNGHGSSSCIMIISRSRDNCSCVLSPLIGILLSYTLFNFHFFKLNQSCLEFLLVDQFFFQYCLYITCGAACPPHYPHPNYSLYITCGAACPPHYPHPNAGRRRCVGHNVGARRLERYPVQ